ncbi:hypothetical protein D3C75_683500 [compost metagenome]
MKIHHVGLAEMLAGQLSDNIDGGKGDQALIAAPELALQAGDSGELDVEDNEMASLYFPFEPLHPVLQISFGIGIQIPLEQLMQKVFLHMRKLLGQGVLERVALPVQCSPLPFDQLELVFLHGSRLFGH